MTASTEDARAPRPVGLDRVERAADGTLALLALHPKPWTPRDDSGRLAVPGTAVEWDGALYEVLRSEPRAAGGYRYVLAPWDDVQLVRTLVAYGAQGPPSRNGVAAAGAPTWWSRLPAPLRDLAPGFVAAVFFGWFFPVRVMGEGISALVHELGHTAAAWLFGCTALPAIVLTIAFEQVVAAAVAIWGGIVWAAIRFRRTPRWNVALAAAAFVYPLLAFTTAHVTFFDLGGHLAELGFAAWALARAARGERPAWERPIWSFFGFYLVARNVRLFGGVATSASARTDYLTVAIADRNDLVKVAAATGIPLETLAAVTAILFAAVALATVLVAFRGSASS